MPLDKAKVAPYAIIPAPNQVSESAEPNRPVLWLEPEIVGRYINSIYGKLGEVPRPRDEQVHAI